MKISTLCLAAISTAPWLASALPGTLNPSGPRIRDVGYSTPITDEAELATLQALHEETLDKIRHGKEVFVHPEDLPQHLNHTGEGPLDKRLFVLWGLAGAALVEAGGAAGGVLAGLAGQLAALFTDGSDTIWTDTEYCRVEFETWAGWRGRFKSWDRHKSGGDHEFFEASIAWLNPASTAPPIWYFENPHLGRYSVQFTATDTVAWSDIPGTQRCKMQGICNPQYVFYHNGYNIVINTWESQGRISACQYEGDCKGMCFSKIVNQFSKGGKVWGGDCAVPCIGDGGDAWE